MSYKLNKGFTLVELLAVIAILAIIALTTYPVVGAVINHSRQRSYETQVKLIEEAAIGYVSENEKDLFVNDSVSSVNVTLTQLKNSKAISNKKLTNPKTEKPMNGCVKISKDSYGQYKAKYQDAAC